MDFFSCLSRRLTTRCVKFVCKAPVGWRLAVREPLSKHDQIMHAGEEIAIR